MKPIASPLRIVDFAVMRFELEFIPPCESEEIDFEEYEIDIDFSFRKDDYLQVFIKTDINKGKEKYCGYSISAEAACVFTFDNNVTLSEQQKQNIEGFSTIYIALNSLRGFISQFTASGPIGRYIFPSIDLNDLIEQKKAILSSQLKQTNNSKKMSKKNIKKKK